MSEIEKVALELGRLQVLVGEISMEIANLTFRIEELQQNGSANVDTAIAKKIALERDMQIHQEEIKEVMLKMEKLARS